MNTMNIFFAWILPLALIVVTLQLPRLRAWLQSLAGEVEGQAELVGQFQSMVSRFMRETNAEDHGTLREVLVWVGSRMTVGTDLVDALARRRESSASIDHSEPDELDMEFDRLNGTARHALAHALGLALCISAGQSLLHRERYRKLLEWVVTFSSGEVREPKQIVHRYQKAAGIVVGGAARMEAH